MTFNDLKCALKVTGDQIINQCQSQMQDSCNVALAVFVNLFVICLIQSIRQSAESKSWTKMSYMIIFTVYFGVVLTIKNSPLVIRS